MLVGFILHTMLAAMVSCCAVFILLRHFGHLSCNASTVLNLSTKVFTSWPFWRLRPNYFKEIWSM